MYFKATFSNGYCGCDNTYYFKANNEADVEEFMRDGLYDYAQEYDYVHFGWGNDYTDDEWEEYYDNCSYCIEEITDMDDLEFEDITDLTV